MITTLLSFGLDIVILVALGITIFYAIKLSSNLNKFRLHREEFLSFMGDLNKTIEAAEDAVENLKQASLATGDQLRRKVRDGQHLADELKIMIESGESLANRLEQSAEEAGGAQSKKKVKIQPKSSVQDIEENDWFLDDIPEPPNNNEKPQIDEDIPSFFIQDREFDDEDEDERGQGANADQANENLQSQAERELYEALQKNKKNKSGK